MGAVVFWTAIVALAVCVAAAVRVYAPRGIMKRARHIRLEGRWSGDLGDHWSFLADIQVTDSSASGRIQWTLAECPPLLPWARKVGAKGHELVEGRLKSGVLRLSGKKFVEGADAWMAPSDYTIPLPSRGNQFEGQSSPQERGKWQEGGKLRGTVSYPTKAPPQFESQ